MKWIEARKFARNGQQVRRALWPPDWELCFEKGGGTARSVAMLDAGIAAADVVRSGEFNEADWLADDWMLGGEQPESDKEPLEIHIYSLGPQDDDLRVSVDGIPVFDGRCNVSWYYGETSERGNANFNLHWETDGFRIVRLTRRMTHVMGCRVLPGTLISVDVFDGWGGTWRTSPWIAHIYWANGAITEISGGWVSSGESVGTPPVTTDYFPGYLDGNTFFSRYTLLDYDRSVMWWVGPGVWLDENGVENDEGVGYLVDGHAVWEFSGNGKATIIEATGNYTILHPVGEVWNIGEVLAITAGTKESNTIRNFNTSGSAIHGVLSVPAAVGPAYYSSEAHFRSYIPNGGFTVPEPPE